MKLNTNIIILITTALVLTSTLIGLISTRKTYRTGNDAVARIERMSRDNLQRIKADGEREAAAYREELLANKKEYLKSEVQAARSILEAVEKETGLSPQDSQQIASGLHIDDIDALMNDRKAEIEKRLQTEVDQWNKEIETTKKEIQNSVRSIAVWIAGITLAMLVVVLIVSIVFNRRTTARPPSRIIESPNERADQLASAAEQISSTSQQMAAGVSIEETLSSLEEMYSRTRTTRGKQTA